MAEFSAERDLLSSQFSLFNEILRQRGQAFLDGILIEIRRLEVNGMDRADATRLVVERTILAEGAALDRFRDDMVREFRNLISQSSVGVFQMRLDRLADESFQTGETSDDPEDRFYVWVSVGSSATCRWRDGADRYVMNGKRLTRMSFCLERHGLRGDAAYWDAVGRPRAGQTVCLGNCECTLVPARFARANPGLLEGVDLSDLERTPRPILTAQTG